jgi:hypothetical protein
MATELDPASRIVLKMRPGLPLGFALYIPVGPAWELGVGKLVRA